MSYPQEIKDKAIALYLSGESLKNSGKPFGVPATTVKQWLLEKGHKIRPTHDVEEVERLKPIALQLYKSGYSMQLVGELVGRSRLTISKWIKDAGITPRKKGEDIVEVAIGLTPELESIPPDERKRFLLEAIVKALNEKKEQL